MVPPACKFAGLPAVAGWLRNVEQHRGEAPSCGAGARTRQELRQSTGGWGGTPSAISVLDFGLRFTAFCRCSVLVKPRTDTSVALSIVSAAPRLAQIRGKEYFHVIPEPSFRNGGTIHEI